MVKYGVVYTANTSIPLGADILNATLYDTYDEAYTDMMKDTECYRHYAVNDDFNVVKDHYIEGSFELVVNGKWLIKYQIRKVEF